MLADLIVGLTRNRHPEILLPPIFDEGFWRRQDSAADFAEYLTTMGRVDVPTIGR